MKPEDWGHFTKDGPPEDEEEESEPQAPWSGLSKEAIAAIALVAGAAIAFFLMSGPRHTSPSTTNIEPSSYRTAPPAPTFSPPTTVSPPAVAPPAATDPLTLECQAKGGYRTVNPSTGRPSCFVPDRPSSAGTAKMPNTPDCAAKGGYRTINPSTGRPSCYVP